MSASVEDQQGVDEAAQVAVEQRTTDQRTLLGILAERAEGTDGDRIWLEDIDGRTQTYAQAYESSLRWADVYRRVGVGSGDVVVTMQLNTFEYLLGWLGLSWLRAIEAPINTDYRGDLLRHVLDNTRAKVMLVRQEYVDRIAAIADQLEHLKTVVVVDPTGDPLPDLPFDVVHVDDLLSDANPIEPVPVPDPWDIACVMYTSGTTGPSKGVLMPWGQFHAWALMWDADGDMGPDEVFHCPGPTFHVPAKMLPYLAAILGAKAYMRPYIHIASTADDLRKVTFAIWVFPQAINEWLAEPETPEDKNVMLRRIPAGPIFPGLLEFLDRFDVRTLRIFNMTEAGCPIVDPGWNQSHFAPDGTPSVGKVRQGYPHYEVRLVDEHDQEVPAGVPGELIVRTSVPWTMNAGYLNMPEATANAWRNGWYHTGDGLYKDDRGNFFFKDRIKDSIRRRDENISSSEVELLVYQHPAVQEVAAVAARGGYDEEVKICVVRKPDEKLTHEELIEYLIPRMPRFMVPRYVEFMDELPKTPTAKVRKFILRENAVNENTWDREAAGIVVPR
ncbi:AMP-binding protein [Nocardia sp. NBC_00508]|uniref:AMP-binding protein n=1 Tax=Nocardia sp. NBC_00508 TaxID=2975992 RepID=UPI002E7FE36A|nr:AMP-binding protein [Nocardia sp. NBC_00508]WUD67100.1 AMP-binding protein [Nocardia sp. NBC_00508]